MLTRFKTTLAAAAIVMLPMVASAATVTLAEGGSTAIVLGNNYEYQETVTSAGAGSSTFTLTATPPQPISLESEYVTLEFTGIFENLVISLMTDLGTVTATAGLSGPSVRFFSLDTILNAVNGFSQTLTISWDSIIPVNGSTTAQFNIQAVPSQVPVPAAGLLLLSALGGVAALRRRRKSATA